MADDGALKGCNVLAFAVDLSKHFGLPITGGFNHVVVALGPQFQVRPPHLPGSTSELQELVQGLLDQSAMEKTLVKLKDCVKAGNMLDLVSDDDIVGGWLEPFLQFDDSDLDEEPEEDAEKQKKASQKAEKIETKKKNAKIKSGEKETDKTGNAEKTKKEKKEKKQKKETKKTEEKEEKQSQVKEHEPAKKEKQTVAKRTGKKTKRQEVKEIAAAEVKKVDEGEVDDGPPKKSRWLLEEWLNEAREKHVLTDEAILPDVLHSYANPLVAIHVAIVENTPSKKDEVLTLNTSAGVERAKVLVNYVTAFKPKVPALCIVRRQGFQARPLTVPEALSILGFADGVNLMLLTPSGQKDALAKAHEAGGRRRLPVRPALTLSLRCSRSEVRGLRSQS